MNEEQPQESNALTKTLEYSKTFNYKKGCVNLSFSLRLNKREDENCTPLECFLQLLLEAEKDVTEELQKRENNPL